MDFQLDKSIEILERTPQVLISMLSDISKEWIYSNEGEESWSPYDVIGHLVHGELTDWIPRAEIILDQGDNLTFEPFDRFAQKESSKGEKIQSLLEEFDQLRAQNLEMLISFEITEEQLKLTGIHPELGEVTLQELLSTWVTHDLGHIAQIARVVAKQYKSEVGPWLKYIPILSR